MLHAAVSVTAIVAVIATSQLPPLRQADARFIEVDGPINGIRQYPRNDNHVSITVGNNDIHCNVNRIGVSTATRRFRTALRSSLRYRFRETTPW